MTSLTTLHTGLTYDKVIRDIDKRELRTGSVEQNWNNYIDIARSLLAVSEISRMAVAEVAIRATICKSGGDRQSFHYKNVSSKLTVKSFANSIGVKPNTLWLWIKIKEKVFDKLNEKERKKFKHVAGERTFRLLGSKQAVDIQKSRKLYKTLSTKKPGELRAARAIKYLMSIRKVFLKYSEFLTEKQIQAIRISLLEILKMIEEKNAV